MFERPVFSRHLITGYFRFLVRYRTTFLGPWLLLVGPTLFVIFLGQLYAVIGAASRDVFIPHLAIGLILWTIIAGAITHSPSVFARNKSYVLQGVMGLRGIIAVDMVILMLSFLHQTVIIIVVMVIFKIVPNIWALTALPALGLYCISAYSIAMIFGILGARFGDLAEILSAVMRIAFLATPILWMVGDSMRGSLIGSFVNLNPFYHYLEIVRAPLLGDEIALLSWAVAGGVTVVSVIISTLLYRTFGRYVATWL